MSARTRIATDIDYERDGKQVDWLYLPHSVTRSAYGNIAFPVAVIKNGSGPTVLLTAGTHGDEYEGQVALAKLVRSLEPHQVQGRVIIITAANLPAALAGARVSPIDQGNLNRAYPGDPDGGPTSAIAHYIDSFLFPITDYYHDLHSGGSSLDYLPFCSMRRSNDKALDEKAMAALKAFGAPIGFVWGFSPDVGFAVSAAVARGIVALGGEFGGGGMVAVEGVRIVERGLRNLLAHVGVIEAKHATPVQPSRLVEILGRDYYVLAPEEGLFEPFVELGQMVEAGQPCGQVHFVDNPGRAPVPVAFRRAGLLICKRHFGRVVRGDCVAHLATDIAG